MCQERERKHKLLRGYILDVAQLISSQTYMKKKRKIVLKKEKVVAAELEGIDKIAYLPSVFHVFTLYFHYVSV